MPAQTDRRAPSRAPLPRHAPAPVAMPESSAPPRQASPTPESVESLLADLIAAYEQLGTLGAEHRAAISRADGDAVEACARREAEMAAHLAALDERRRAMAAGIDPGQRVTIARLVERLPHPDRAAALASQLRCLVRRVQRDYATIRAATHAIVGHIDGLVQQVGQRLNKPGTYGREGRVQTGSPLACGIDVTR